MFLAEETEESLNELKLPRKVVMKVLEKIRKYADNPQNQALHCYN